MNIYIFIIAWLTIGLLTYKLFDRSDNPPYWWEVAFLFLWPVVWLICTGFLIYEKGLEISGKRKKKEKDGE